MRFCELDSDGIGERDRKRQEVTQGDRKGHFSMKIVLDGFSISREFEVVRRWTKNSVGAACLEEPLGARYKLP